MAGVGETNHCFLFISEGSAHVAWKSVDSWLASVLPIYQVGPEDGTWVIRLGGKHLTA